MSAGSGEDGLGMTDMDAATIAMHEMYLTLQRSGFSKEESLTLISSMLSSMIEKAINMKITGA